MMVTALTIALAAGSIGLRGGSTCPTPQSVQAHLAGLDTDDGNPTLWVEIESTGKSVLLSMWGAHETLEAVREISLPASCDALARASAVAIATWAMRTQSAAPPVDRPTLRSSTPVVAVGQRRIFDPELLEQERFRLMNDVRPSPPPPRLHGPVFMMFSGLIVTASCVAGLAIPRGLGNSDFVFGITMFTVGLATQGAGLIWLLQTVGTASPGVPWTF